MGPCVLVVDDDQVCAEAIGQVLRVAQYQVSVAHHFTTALAILEATPPPAVLITDLVMPNSVNGVALACMARLRNPGIRLIYVTGYDIPRIDRLALGPVMRKPIADEDLLAVVASELAQSGK